MLEQSVPEWLHPTWVPSLGPKLEQFMKNCSPEEGCTLEKLVENCLLWGGTPGAREEGTAETMYLTTTPFPVPLHC